MGRGERPVAAQGELLDRRVRAAESVLPLQGLGAEAPDLGSVLVRRRDSEEAATGSHHQVGEAHLSGVRRLRYDGGGRHGAPPDVVLRRRVVERQAPKPAPVAVGVCHEEAAVEACRAPGDVRYAMEERGRVASIPANRAQVLQGLAKFVVVR